MAHPWLSCRNECVPPSWVRSLLLACLALVGSVFRAQPIATGSSPDTATTARAVAVASGTITVDGRLEDEEWSQAVPTSSFRQREPAEGTSPSFATEFRVVYDENALYVAVIASDPEPQKIVGL